MTYLLSAKTFLPRPRAEVFAFFSDARNLDRLTPSWVGFRILTPGDIPMGAGAKIDYSIRIHGIAVSWRTLIARWDPPHGFIDVQLKGPYRWWHHEHRFEACDGGTRVIDHVKYLAPFAWLTHPLMVSRDVAAIFDYRAQALPKELAASAHARGRAAGTQPAPVTRPS